jgi:hypothetical protein
VQSRIVLAVLCIAHAASADDALPRARVLDQQGVRAFQQGRYRDAIQYFEDALALGGPSSELWNIAKCHQKLDEPEAADEALERYLARGDLSATDRADAERLRKEIQSRPSPITVTSSPSGAKVTIDGRPRGTTPMTVDVPPGTHAVGLTKVGYGAHEEKVTAKWGRAIVVDSSLDGGSSTPIVSVHARPFAIEAGVGVAWGILGGYGGTAYPLGFGSASYAFLDSERFSMGAGIRFAATGDSWGNTVGAPSAGAGCTMPLPSSFSQAELTAQALVNVGWKPRDRWRFGGEAAIGIYGVVSGGGIGGDVYEPSCTTTRGVVPGFHVGLDASYRVLPALRIVLRPLQLDLHPSYEGVRRTPVDAGGLWTRLGFTAGAAFDL